jgi:K+-transporting ATPase KdpF subunit
MAESPTRLRSCNERFADDSRNAGFLRHRDRLYGHLRQAQIGAFMNIENVLMLIISFLLMIYLIYALLKPEKF